MASRRPCDSDAFATSSYATYFVLPNLSAEIFVRAAVVVVLPWSTWPMVPTFTCGLVRSNFALAMGMRPEVERWCGWWVVCYFCFAMISSAFAFGTSS